MQSLAAEQGIDGDSLTEADVLTYALFPQVGLKFLANRGNPAAFEPVPGAIEPQPAAAKPAPAVAPAAATTGPETYDVRVDGQLFRVEVAASGSITQIQPQGAPAAAPAPAAALATSQAAQTPVKAPLAGNIFKVVVSDGSRVNEGDVLVIMEAMKMETEIRAPRAGVVEQIRVKPGDAVTHGDPLLALV